MQQAVASGTEIQILQESGQKPADFFACAPY
jgi:hypothetical protein